eukprot:TRINITY_DN1512_c0_g1_i2.p1 TRINITY_DN1512_c0_g1~~TRINITY_DN1512_c0_g1_i2.p1  ORF type:complete len:489 (-),score=150.49 TRINITY_DN1512_c0_g1_i2:23-1489(-)
MELLLPLPNVGEMKIFVADRPPSGTNFYVGSPLPSGSVVSNTVVVDVHHRIISRVTGSSSLFGMEWEPWFTDHNVGWQTGEAVPLVGRYNSDNVDVIKQHAIWFAQSGMDFLLVDWTNNLWGLTDFSQASVGAWEIINATVRTMEVYYSLSLEGIPVPKMVLLLGLDNGPTTTMTCLNQEIDWIYRNLYSDLRFRNLFQIYEGKPLLIPFDGGNFHETSKIPADDRYFTLRWMSTQFQRNHMNKMGYWSWMDGTLSPLPTFHDGKAEVVTVTNAFFADGGWTYPEAVAQDGGTTLMKEWNVPLAYHPTFIAICQWNEFAGQGQGQGYGPNHDMYYDIFNVTLSNDMEPTSLTEKGYRSTRGGWGFYYVNLLRALRDLQSGRSVEIAGISFPDRDQILTSPILQVTWYTLGISDASSLRFNLKVDGIVLAENISGNSANLNLKSVKNGDHVMEVEVVGHVTRYPLSLRLVDVPNVERPLIVSVPFHLSV